MASGTLYFPEEVLFRKDEDRLIIGTIKMGARTIYLKGRK